MSEFKGTPGPWNVDPRYPGDVQANGQELCSMIGSMDIGQQWNIEGNSDITYDEKNANARLIAAAPELLEALEEAHRALMHYEWYANPKSGWASTDNLTVRGMVDAAIAKALGE
jgi:hypothetical protein